MMQELKSELKTLSRRKDDRNKEIVTSIEEKEKCQFNKEQKHKERLVRVKKDLRHFDAEAQ